MFCIHISTTLSTMEIVGPEPACVLHRTHMCPVVLPARYGPTGREELTGLQGGTEGEVLANLHGKQVKALL